MADIKKFLDQSGLTYLLKKINIKINNKVDKINGKNLSTNDFTTEYKNKIDSISLPLPIEDGGTNATTAKDAIKNLGYASNMVIISQEEPTNAEDGMFWLKPIE